MKKGVECRNKSLAEVDKMERKQNKLLLMESIGDRFVIFE